MKKLALIVLLAVGLSAQAQDQKVVKKEQKKEQMTSDQKNQLRLKKLTLDLNLTPEQQKEMGALLAAQSEKREQMIAERKANKEKGVQMTPDERFAMKSKMLDEQNELKVKVQKILNEGQFKKWEDMRNEKRDDMKERKEKKDDKKIEDQ